MIDPGTPLPVDIEGDPAHVAAAEWFVRLQEASVSVEDTLAWQGWLNESPDNARAFARIEEVSRALRLVPVPQGVPAGRLAADRYDGSVPLKAWRAAAATGVPSGWRVESNDRRGESSDWSMASNDRRPAPSDWGVGSNDRRASSNDRGAPTYLRVRRARRWPWMTLALAAVCAGIAIATLFWRTPTPESYSTTVGENRHINLPDGSTVTLSGDTRISVAFSKKARLVELARGEALFVVTKDPSRPFKVRAGDATVIAVGTAFDVLRDSDRAIVSVTEGRVLVEPVADFIPVAVLREFKPNLRTVRLDAGQQTTAGTAGIAAPSKVEDPAAATSWQTGRLAFHLQPLRYVLEDVNRYAPKPIVLEGEKLGALVITGTVERGNIAGWVESLERAFDLDATEESDRIVIRAR